MGCHSTEQNNKDFVPHEIKTYQRKGDLVRSEYERLNPDGSVTKTIAYGDCKQGLKYRTFQMGLDGAVREIAAEYFTPSKTVTAATQQHQQQQQQQQYDQQQQQKLYQQQLEYQQQQQYLQQLHEHKLKQKELQFQKQQQEARQQLEEARKQQSLETKPQPRKTYTFTVEPKESHDPSVRTFRVRPVKIEQEKPAEEKPTEKASPWWLDQFRDVLSEFKGEQKVPEKPVEPERKPSKSLLNWFDDDFFSSSLKNSILQRPKWTESFDLLGDSFFDRPLLGFSRALLEDF